jgi:hypothetical protein
VSNVNQALTHQLIARKAAAMLVEENTVVANINTDREQEFGKETQGYKPGETVRVKIPPTPITYSGASFAGGGSAPAMNESSVNLTVDQQYHVPLSFTAKEKSLEVSDFEKRFLKPAMVSLSSKVNSILLAAMKDQIPNVVGTWGTVPATRAPYRNADSMISRYLGPEDDRCVHFSLDANDALAEANSTLFHSAKELQDEFAKNSVGSFAGFDFYKQLSLPTHTNGAGASYAVNGASQSGTSLIVKTGTGALTKGTIFTIAGVNGVHPITGLDNGTLRQFVVTADYAGGAGTVSIYPAMTVTSASVVGTIAAAAADSAAITVFGTASQAKRQNLAFHKDAFATAFAPLPILTGCEGYTATVKGISVRVMTFGNGQTDTESTRIDVLFALPAGIRPNHACRITE